MTALTDVEAAVGILLIFFIPGYAITKGIFPEWRISGREATRRAVEVVTLSFVLSVALTVFVGYLLLAAAPGGFQAYWSSPVLEVLLVAISAGAAVVAWWRGAFSATPPVRAPETAPPEEETWELMSQLDRISREERRLRHRLRTLDVKAPERSQLDQELRALQDQREALQSHREAEYAR